MFLFFILLNYLQIDDPIIKISTSVIILITIFKLILYVWMTFKESRQDHVADSGIDQLPPELSYTLNIQAHILLIISIFGMGILSFLGFYLITQIFYLILPSRLTEHSLYLWLMVGILFPTYLMGVEYAHKWIIEQLILWLVRKIPEDQLEFAIHNSNYHTIKSTLEKIPDTPLNFGKKLIVALAHHIVGNYQKCDQLSREGIAEVWSIIKDQLDTRTLYHEVFDHYLMLMAENEILQGKQDQAFDIIKRALKINRNSLVIYNTLCEWYYVNGELDKIQNVLERLEQLPAKRQIPVNYHFFKAIAHAHQNNAIEANKSLETGKKKITAPIQEATYYLHKGRVELILGNSTGARQNLEQAQRLCPTGSIADYAALDFAKLP